MVAHCYLETNRLSTTSLDAFGQQPAGRSPLSRAFAILRGSPHSRGADALTVEIMEQWLGHAGPAPQQVSSSPNLPAALRVFWRWIEQPESPNSSPSYVTVALPIYWKRASICVPFYCTANSDGIDPMLGPRSALNRDSLLDPQSL